MRRLSKTLTWSMLAFMVTTIVGYLVTGDIIKGGMIGLICRGIKVPAFWLHDTAYALWWPTKAVVPCKVEPTTWAEDWELEGRRHLHGTINPPPAPYNDWADYATALVNEDKA